MSPVRTFLALAALLSAVPAPRPLAAQSSDANQVVDTTLLTTLEYRLVGPFRGGRSTTVTGIRGKAHTFLMGTTGGGVWKTEDAGLTWGNLSDGSGMVGSIGAVEVTDSDPNVIYVGTGSAGVRGNVSTGRGVWRSRDAGRSWTFAGLAETGIIGRIAAHPDNPDLVYVAALGSAFGKNAERGVFRSSDGGDSWEKVLFVSDSTGAVDLSMNPENPREIYAAMWRAERKPWTFYDASEDGGIYKTMDGGDTWKELTEGLPSDLTGRIGVSVSPANPAVVYALVSAADPHGGLYRSDDSGESWERVNRNRELRQRHWYYSHVTADPTDENTVYIMNTSVHRSLDGGKSTERVRVPHGDTHDLWINPDNPDLMIVADDGGAQVSLTGGKTWTGYYNQPTAEFYRVEVDNQFPYRLYGAQQDNSTISVPSRFQSDISNLQNWFSVGGSESGHIAVDPRDPNIVYAGNYIGQIDRSDLSAGQRRDILLYPQMQDGTAARDLKYRFQWNAPIVISPHDPDHVYHASNFVHRTRDGGMSWETISPDLTTDNDAQQDLPGGPLQHDHTGVEVYNTIFVLTESALTRGELWAGSDDGLVHISRDDGGTWTDVTPAGMPVGGTVNSIDVSADTPGRAVVAVYRYREDDFRPYVFLTEDWGGSWRSLTSGSNGIPEDHPVRVVRMDPDRRGLLYAGTEFGLFVSFDDGEHWQSLQRNLPITPVTDLKVHQKDLVVATQGRSFWILDDLTPLHELSPEVARGDAHLFQPRDEVRARFSGFAGGPPSPTNGVSIHYWLNDAPGAEVELEILDAAGVVIRSFEGELATEGADTDAAEDDPAESEDTEADEDEAGEGEDDEGADGDVEEEKLEPEAGMNRFVWDMRYRGPETLSGAQFSLANTGGMNAAPGEYQVRLTVDDVPQTHTFSLLLDPRAPGVSQADMNAQFALASELRDKLTEIHDQLAALRSVRDQAQGLAGRIKDGEYAPAIQTGIKVRVDSLAGDLKDVEAELIQTKSESGQDPINFPPRLDDQVAYLYSHVNSTYGAPNQGQRERWTDLAVLVQPHLDRIIEIFETRVAELNRYAAENGVSGVLTGRPRRIIP